MSSLMTEHADTFESINDLYEEYASEKEKLFDELEELKEHFGLDISKEKENKESIDIVYIEYMGKQYPVRECIFLASNTVRQCLRSRS